MPPAVTDTSVFKGKRIFAKNDLLPYDRAFRRSDVFVNAKKRHKCCAHADSLDGRRVGEFHFCDKKVSFKRISKNGPFGVVDRPARIPAAAKRGLVSAQKLAVD